jgi:hypothetical protein
LWYWWKIDEVRPLLASHSIRAWSRGVSVKPPAAPPQSTPQVGTSRAPVTHSPAGLAGAVGAGVAGLVATGAAGAGVAALVVTISSGRPVVLSADFRRVVAVVDDDRTAKE